MRVISWHYNSVYPNALSLEKEKVYPNFLCDKQPVDFSVLVGKVIRSVDWYPQSTPDIASLFVKFTCFNKGSCVHDSYILFSNSKPRRVQLYRIEGEVSNIIDAPVICTSVEHISEGYFVKYTIKTLKGSVAFIVIKSANSLLTEDASV